MLQIRLVISGGEVGAASSRKLFFFVLCIGVAYLCDLPAAHARSTSFNSIQYRPSPFADRFFTVDGSSVQHWGEALLGLDADFSTDSMARTPRGGTKQEIVDNLLVLHFLTSVGISDWLSLGLEFPFAVYEKYLSPTSGVSDNRMKPGDLLFAAKFSALDKSKYPIGLAVEPFATFPTGSGSSFVGNNSFTGGAKLILDKSFAGKVETSLNVGYLARDRVNILGTTIDDRLMYGFGLGWRFYQGWALNAEVYGSTVVSDAFKKKTQSPLEADLGFTYEVPGTGLKIAFGGGAGIIKNNGVPLYRASLGISYRFGKGTGRASPYK